MLTTVPNLVDKDQRTARLSALRYLIDSAEMVDSYCADYLIAGDFGGIVDREQITADRVERIMGVLDDLDTVVASIWQDSIMDAVATEGHLGGETVGRARALARAIREALADMIGANLSPVPPVDADDASVSPIVTTGQFARVERSIVAGQPRSVSFVEVVEVDGDTLKYKSGDYWFSTVTQSDLAYWEIVDDEVANS